MVHTKSLLRTAIRICVDRALAEDLVQETMLKAWRAFEQYESGTNCKAWLFRIMLNLSSKRMQQQRRAPPIVSLDDQPEWKGPGTGPAPLGFTNSNVYAALQAIAEEYRVVLLLGVVEGFSCKEMAGMLAIPMGTVMSRLSRGRAALREQLLRLENQPAGSKIHILGETTGGLTQ